jgi:L-alanine-DL-glutamate epimerase-like enolase superfamily enzyme
MACCPAMARTYDLIKDLPLRIERYELEPRSRPVLEVFTRHTTIYHVHGAGEEGVGEDVTYDPEDQQRQQAAGPVLELAGDWTIETFSAHLESLNLFPARPPSMPAYTDYRRWGLESAALDLALRQAGQPLHAVLGREPRPLRFGVSLRLGAPPSVAAVADRLSTYGGVRFKLDADPEWDEALIAALADTGAVDVIDFKGAYKGTPVDVDTDPVLYRRCAEAFPEAWLEDPDLTPPDADAALEPHRDRITWDAPIHSVADVQGLPFAPKGLNCKPSRFGTLARLFDFYDYAASEGIALYGGGQSELGPGRGQIQLLAALFHPDGPNDVAPSGWDHDDFPRQGLPVSPLDPAPAPTGFQRAD